MDATNNRIHSRRAANGITMFRGAVMAGFLVSTLMTALPSTTFADGRDGDRMDDKVKHSLVQHPYDAHAVKNPFAILQAQIDALKAQLASVDALKAQLTQADIPTLKTSVSTLQGSVSTLNTSVSMLQGSVTALDTKVDTKTADVIPGLGKYLKVDTTNVLNGMAGPHILFTGANVHVRNGSGATDSNNLPYQGLGNLIVGYNENTTPTPTLQRTGSHNLVGGGMNSFSSVGGMVFGFQNTISGPYANVVGGSVNLAQGPNSTVYGSNLQRAVNLNSYAPVQGTRPGGTGN